MNAPDIVETDRLHGERLRPCHWPLWHRMGTDVTLMATLGGIWTEEQARERLEWNCRQWEENGHGQWLFFLKDTADLVGRCGLRRMTVNGREEVELGYSVLPELWGKGFATEMGEKSLTVGFQSCGHSSIVAFTLVGNHSSERVMQKLGFRFERRIIRAGQPHVLYRRENPNRALDGMA